MSAFFEMDGYVLQVTQSTFRERRVRFIHGEARG